MSIKHSKIEELYLNFSKYEKDGISNLLKSNLFAQTDIMEKIHEYMCTIVGEELNKVELYKYVYGPKSIFSDGKLRVYMTKLTKIIEKFIMIQHMDDYPSAELNLLLKYYNENHLHKNVFTYFKSKEENRFGYFEEYLLFEYQYQQRKLDFINREFPNHGVKIKEQFELLLSAQKKFSLFQTLKTHCDFLSISLKYQLHRDCSFEETIIASIIDSEYNQDPIFRAYIIVYQLFKEPNESLFQELNNIIIKENNVKFIDTSKALLSILQNFCIRFINTGQSEYLNFLFENYKFGLQFIKKSGDLTSASYRNITYCALQLNEIEWAESFVVNYYTMVTENDQDNAYNLNLARIGFVKKEYKIAMRHLLRVTYEDAFYASSARILLIKCYYELNDEFPLMSYCASLMQYLHRNKEFTKARIEYIIQFIKFVKSLQNNRLKNSKEFFKKMSKKISESSSLEKDWLILKLAEINK